MSLEIVNPFATISVFADRRARSLYEFYLMHPIEWMLLCMTVTQYKHEELQETFDRLEKKKWLKAINSRGR